MIQLSNRINKGKEIRSINKERIHRKGQGVYSLGILWERRCSSFAIISSGIFGFSLAISFLSHDYIESIWITLLLLEKILNLALLNFASKKKKISPEL